MTDDMILLGETNWRGQSRRFGMKPPDRRQHTVIWGRTGTGKSTLLENLIVQDLKACRGLCLVDPHGDLISQVLAHVPKHRAHEVVYFSPADYGHPLALNILERVDRDRRHAVASAVVAIFKDVWGTGVMARSEDLLRNAVTALLDLPASTLLWLPRWLTDDRFREQHLEAVSDPVVRDFWLREYGRYTSPRKAEVSGPILNKIRSYITSAPLRNIFGQITSKVDFCFMMDNSRILLVNLAKGEVGEDKSTIVGKLVMMKLCLAAFSRVDTPEHQRTDFHIYADEFHCVASPIMASGLSELRKFATSLTLASQFGRQIPLGCGAQSAATWAPPSAFGWGWMMPKTCGRNSRWSLTRATS
jgi:hypothetical protein